MYNRARPGHFGLPDRVDAVARVLARQRLTRELPWFAASARNVRMLGIEENNDLRPAIESADKAIKGYRIRVTIAHAGREKVVVSVWKEPLP